MSFKGESSRKRLILIAVITVLAASALVMGFSTVFAKNVNLIIDGKEERVVTFSETVGELLKTKEIVLGEDKVVSPAEDTELTEGMDIVISELKTIVLTDGSGEKEVKAVGDTVEEILDYLDIEIDKDDVVTPTIEKEAEDNQRITIERVDKKHYNKVSEIPYETEIVENPEMYEGDSKTIQQGVVGQRIEKIQNTYVNDNLVSIDVIERTDKVEPVKHIVEKGTKKIESPVEGKSVKKVIVMEATAYDPTAGSKTAMGTKARVGAVAVDPKVIPLGTKLYIESMDGFPTYGYAVAEDTGGAIKGNRIDLFYNTNAQALKFGRRNVKVYVLD